MMRNLLIFTLFFLGAEWATLSAQRSLYNKKEDALLLFKNGKYEDVVATLASARKLLRQDPESKLCLAISYYQTNKLNRALQLIDEILSSDQDSYPEAIWYKARIYHSRNEFAEAADWYKAYLKGLRVNDPQRKMVIDAIRRCSNGFEFKYKAGLAVVENLGVAVNSSEDEFAPVLSPNHPDVLYFSTIRKDNMGGKRDQYGNIDDVYGVNQSDMYSCKQKGGYWADPEPMHFFLNSSDHDVLLDFNSKGNSLFYFKGQRLDAGQIFIDTFKSIEERSISTNPLISPIDPRAGDGMLFVANDELIFFSSRRSGGYGGYDIYQMRRSGSYWEAPENLGPDINTEYDEISPFMSRDGRTLYYSSNNSKISIGGFDVFKSIYLSEQDRWVPPINQGMPINSAADDTYFRLAKDGHTGFFCSSRSDGYGQRDIYAAYFKDYLMEMDFIPPKPSGTTPPKATTVSGQPSNTYTRPPALPPTTEPGDTELTKPNPDLVAPPRPVEENPGQQFDQVEEPDLQPAFNAVLYPGSNNDEFSPEQLNQLRTIAGILETDFDLNLVITAYKPQSDFVGEDLFAGIKFAESASDYLVRSGIGRERVYTRALCHGYEDIALFSFVPTNGRDLASDLPHLEQAARATTSPNVPVNSNCFYKIQIVSLKGPASGPLITRYDWPMAEKSGNGYYRYTLGAFTSYREARQLQDEIRRNGSPDAFVVPYLYGMRADTEWVRQNLDRFPDLRNFVNRR